MTLEIETLRVFPSNIDVVWNQRQIIQWINKEDKGHVFLEHF